MFRKIIYLPFIFYLLFAEGNKVGIYIKLLESDLNFQQTVSQLEENLSESNLSLYATHDIRVPGDVQKSRLYVLTSENYKKAAFMEHPNSISAQVIRLAVYEYGEGKKTYINMTNPMAHAMVYYADSDHYSKLLNVAKTVVEEMESVVNSIPGNHLLEQMEPTRTEKELNNFNGNGPAKIMTLYRDWEGSQDNLFKERASNFEKALNRIETIFNASVDEGPDKCEGWQIITKIPIRFDAVYYGITNTYSEAHTININSDYRELGKFDDAPLPGVDHTPAFPIEIIVYNDGVTTRVIQYAQMWRMQLYYWDSGYVAFGKYTLIPGAISGSIDDLFEY